MDAQVEVEKMLLEYKSNIAIYNMICTQIEVFCKDESIEGLALASPVPKEDVLTRTNKFFSKTENVAENYNREFQELQKAGKNTYIKIKDVDNMLITLQELEKYIIEQKYFHGKTYKEIEKSRQDLFGREQIRKIKNIALQKMGRIWIEIESIRHKTK